MRDVMVLARTPAEMESSHERLVEWFAQKQKSLSLERARLETEHAIAVRRKWSRKPFERQLNLIARRQLFYDKVQQALKAGYRVVPNFFMNAFAVRVNTESPKAKMLKSRYAGFHHPPEIQNLPAGMGRYVGDKLTAETWDEQEPEKNHKGEMVPVTQHYSLVSDFTDIDFPLELARPEIMEATGEALDQLIFDEIGISRDQARGCGDPFVLGRIRNPAKHRADMTFFIGWTFDPSRV